jgi:hypothetical protein
MSEREKEEARKRTVRNPAIAEEPPKPLQLRVF